MKTVSRKACPERSRRDAKLAKGNISPGDYHAPWWLPGGHLQTIYARTLAQNYPVQYRRERWETPDDDFIDLDWLDDSSDSGRLIVLFHSSGCREELSSSFLTATRSELGYSSLARIPELTPPSSPDRVQGKLFPATRLCRNVILRR